MRVLVGWDNELEAETMRTALGSAIKFSENIVDAAKRETSGLVQPSVTEEEDIQDIAKLVGKEVSEKGLGGPRG